MSRPYSDETVVTRGKVSFQAYVDVDLGTAFRDYLRIGKITFSDFTTAVISEFLNLKTERDIEISLARKAARIYHQKIADEENITIEEHHQIAIDKIKTERSNEELKRAEAQAAETKAADEEKVYREKVWRALRKEIIYNYEVISLQLKEIAAHKHRGDEEEYEAGLYSEIRSTLEYKKILHSQRDLSYATFLECFESVNYEEEVLKPRLQAEKEMQEEEEDDDEPVQDL